jgi:hypothetical protein
MGNYGLPATKPVAHTQGVNKTEYPIHPASRQEPPLPGERVRVIAQDFRCLGYINDRGIWHRDIDDVPIEENVIGWEPFD